MFIYPYNEHLILLSCMNIHGHTDNIYKRNEDENIFNNFLFNWDKKKKNEKYFAR